MVYSRSLCQSAICRRGEFITSFQWFNAEPLLRGPPSSNRPMTSFFVTRSQSSSISSKETPSRVWPEPSVVGMSNAKLSLKTGLNVLFLTWVFFFAIRCPCVKKHYFMNENKNFRNFSRYREDKFWHRDQPVLLHPFSVDF